MHLVSRNINSLRVSLDLLRRLVKEEQPDVICLQEVKVQDSEFPAEEPNPPLAGRSPFWVSLP
jgi:exodeoxyribonuclease-3